MRPGLGDASPGAGSTTHVALVDPQRPGGLEDLQVAGQVALGQARDTTHEAEIGLAELVQGGEDRQTAALVHDIGQSGQRA